MNCRVVIRGGAASLRRRDVSPPDEFFVIEPRGKKVRRDAGKRAELAGLNGRVRARLARLRAHGLGEVHAEELPADDARGPEREAREPRAAAQVEDARRRAVR